MPPNGIGTWDHNTKNCSLLNDRVRPLACYSDYNDKHDEPNCWEYDAAWDWRGPQFYAPTQCLKTYSWNKPKIASPLMGVIGAQSDLTDSFGQYYIGLRKI